jgi:hypothetical protein
MSTPTWRKPLSPTYWCPTIFHPKGAANGSILRIIISSCISLDASKFEPYMKEDDVFGNKEKYIFLSDLKKLFQPYQSKTNLFSVKTQDKKCLGCNKGKNAVQFIIYSNCDTREVYDFAFVIDTDNGILKDIYRCWHYTQCQPFQIKPEGLPSITVRDLSCE